MSDVVAAAEVRPYTPKQAAPLLGISYRALLNLVDARAIEVLRPIPTNKRFIRFTPEAIEQYKASHSTPAKPLRRARRHTYSD